MQEYGMYAFTGPNWEEDRKLLYEEFYDNTYWWQTFEEAQPVSVENEMYWTQIVAAMQF